MSRSTHPAGNLHTPTDPQARIDKLAGLIVSSQTDKAQAMLERVTVAEGTEASLALCMAAAKQLAAGMSS
jgi:hypothetical protein